MVPVQGTFVNIPGGGSWKQAFNLGILFKAIFVFERVLLIQENLGKPAFLSTQVYGVSGFY